MKFKFFISILIPILFLSCDNSTNNDKSNCGDNFVDLGEQCDGENLGGHFYQELGFYGGTLYCKSDCSLNISNCQSFGFCGDNVIQSNNESCDGNKMEFKNCSDLGYASGSLSCGDDCRYDLSDCTGGEKCGNGSIESPEKCDATDLGGETC